MRQRSYDKRLCVYTKTSCLHGTLRATLVRVVGVYIIPDRNLWHGRAFRDLWDRQGECAAQDVGAAPYLLWGMHYCNYSRSRRGVGIQDVQRASTRSEG